MRYNRISPMSELSLLIQESFLVLIGETRNLIISLLFPVIAMMVTIWIAGEDMYENFEATKSACFIVVCAAIWCGLFNSIQVVVKERAIIKRPSYLLLYRLPDNPADSTVPHSEPGTHPQLPGC